MNTVAAPFVEGLFDKSNVAYAGIRNCHVHNKTNLEPSIIKPIPFVHMTYICSACIDVTPLQHCYIDS